MSVSEGSHEWYQLQITRLEQKLAERDREISGLKTRNRELGAECSQLQGERINAEIVEAALNERIAGLLDEMNRLKIRYQDQIPVVSMDGVLRTIRGQVAQGFHTWKPMPYDRSRALAEDLFEPAFRKLRPSEEDSE